MRVLLIEDEVDLLRAVAQYLSEQGYAVDRATEGEEGLRKALAAEFDAIVLDLMLPRVDGWQVLSRLRAEKHTPVLILTAQDAVGDRVRGLDAGADDYLVKPFSLAELAARVRALIRRTGGNSRSVVMLGDVTVDTTKRTVTRDGEPILLTAREYELLEMFAIHRGKLITRTMIYDRLYGEEDNTLSNLIDVHISHLRKKLGRDLITTRRGQGYVLDA